MHPPLGRLLFLLPTGLLATLGALLPLFTPEANGQNAASSFVFAFVAAFAFAALLWPAAAAPRVEEEDFLPVAIPAAPEPAPARLRDAVPAQELAAALAEAARVGVGLRDTRRRVLERAGWAPGGGGV